MKIKRERTGVFTIEMSETELAGIRNLLEYASGGAGLSARDEELIAEVNGRIIKALSNKKVVKHETDST